MGKHDIQGIFYIDKNSPYRVWSKKPKPDKLIFSGKEGYIYWFAKSIVYHSDFPGKIRPIIIKLNYCICTTKRFSCDWKEMIVSSVRMNTWIRMNSILHTVGHFLMQIAISQEFPLESIIIILTASCLCVTYNGSSLHVCINNLPAYFRGSSHLLQKSQQSLFIKKVLFCYNSGNVPQNWYWHSTTPWKRREGFDKKIRYLNESIENQDV